MKTNKLLLIGAAGMLMLWSCDNSKKIKVSEYPVTQTVDTVDVYFGQEIADPFRWLEDDLSEETANWVTAQNEVTYGYLNQIPFKEQIRARLEEVWNYEKLSSPVKHGDYFYYYRNDGLQNQSVMYRKKDLKSEEEELFLDPNTFSKDGTTSLAGSHFSKDGSKYAFTISEGGSDWRKIIIIDPMTKELVEDTLRDVKFSGVSWKGNEGFYYSTYEKPKGSQLSAKTDQHKLMYHQLGTPQSADKLVFGGSETPRRYIGGYVSDDQNFLIISASVSTSGNELYIKDLRKENSPIVNIVDNFDNNNNIIETDGDRLLIQTNLNAPNNRLVAVDVNQPTPENWVDLIPETENVLGVSKAGRNLFANYMVDVQSKVYQYDYDGKLIREVNLPGIGTSSGFSGRKKAEHLYYTFTSFTYPSAIFKYNIKSGESTMYWKPNIDFNPEDYITEQVFYPSKDGTKIPMFITYKKGLDMNKKNPTYLYAYGGFNVSMRPGFSVARLVWLENGGIYAQPNLRGGGEYGEKWHKAGTQLNKQNVFDDFIAAAEYLFENNYTSSDYLSIAGGSNGGLLVGATMTQRPDLAKVAFPAVGVLDMLRYHKFTAGAGWATDYGTSEQSEEMFRYILAYSPVHNVKENTAYPATMVTTADHDDRVVPAHSFKFAAELQRKHKGDNPVLIRIETNAGHGAGKPTAMIIDEWADKYAFAWYNMGVNPYKK